MIKIDDGAPMRLVVQTCDLNGCYAGEQISAELLTAMKSGKQFAIVFQDLTKKDITVSLTLERFAEAFERIQSRGRLRPMPTSAGGELGGLGSNTTILGVKVRGSVPF